VPDLIQQEGLAHYREVHVFFIVTNEERLARGDVCHVAHGRRVADFELWREIVIRVGAFEGGEGSAQAYEPISG
jgi:hypothetical protein